MQSNAAGQLLGYTIQFPRAFYHLLRSGPGETVCVEVLGDVVRKKKDGMVIAEEDKSSINSKPITDKSIDLWKTFYNWIVAIKEGSLDQNKTKFLLYCNKSGLPSLVDQFSNAINIDAATDALEKAKEKLSDVTPEHRIWPYYDFVMNQNEDLFLQIIPQIEVQYGQGAGYAEVDFEIRKKHIHSSQVDPLRDKINGWLLKIIQERIFDKKPACISWEEFDHQFLVLYERVRLRELVDFTLESLPVNEEIQQHVKVRPKYIQQLDCIGCSDGEILEAVSDFLRADVNLHKWIEKELIDEDSADDFINKLQSYWDNKKNEIRITQKGLEDEEKGQLLLSKCKSRQETIRGNSPPHPTIAGAYHALAEKPILGWHPSWEKLLSVNEEE